jgi:hypothetical protein
MAETKHIIDEAEWKACEALGFVIYAPDVKLSLPDFVAAYFSGLELFKFLKEIDDILKPMSANKLTKVISYNDVGSFELVMQYYSEDSDDPDNGLALSRTLIVDDSGKVAVHDFFRIPKSFRKGGHGKAILRRGFSDK